MKIIIVDLGTGLNPIAVNDEKVGEAFKRIESACNRNNLEAGGVVAQLFPYDPISVEEALWLLDDQLKEIKADMAKLRAAEAGEED